MSKASQAVETPPVFCSAVLTGALLSLQLPQPQQLNPDTDHKFLQNRHIVLVLLVSSYCDILLRFRKPFISVVCSGLGR